MAAKISESGRTEAAPGLPEIIEAADLETLNQALAALFGDLRFASSLPRGQAPDRQATVVALRAAGKFLLRFKSAQAETLHEPLMNLSSALLALNENNVELNSKADKAKRSRGVQSRALRADRHCSRYRDAARMDGALASERQ